MNGHQFDRSYRWTGLRRAGFFDGHDTADIPSPSPWQDALVHGYPDLFRSSSPAARAGRLTVGDGWRETVEILVNRLSGIVQAKPFAIVRIFENCGTLRVDKRASAAIDSETLLQADYAIALAEARSACTCEKCGREGQLYLAGSARITRCSQHAVGEAAHVRIGMERVHLIRRLAGWRPGSIGAGRYDRATDTFADIDLSTLHLEDRS